MLVGQIRTRVEASSLASAVSDTGASRSAATTIVLWCRAASIISSEDALHLSQRNRPQPMSIDARHSDGLEHCVVNGFLRRFGNRLE